MDPTTTYGLIERGKAGDSEAWSLLFEKYRPRLAVLVHYRMGPDLAARYEVDDVLQEILLRAFRDFGHFTYQSPGSFFRWLAAIAGHVLADLGRHHGRDRRRAEEMVRFRSESNPGGVELADTKTPSRILAQQESVDALIARLDALPENYRQAILLAKFEGLTTADLAARLETTRENAALVLHRALKRFRELAAG